MNMIRGLILLFLGNGVSKGLGFLREVLVAYWFGTSFITDAYRVAQTAILLPTQLLMGNAFQAAFVPSYKKNVAEQREAQFFGMVFYIICFLCVLLTLMFFFGGGLFVQILSPGFSGEAKSFTAELLGIMAFGILFYACSNLIVYVFNANGEFGLSSVASITQNVVFILFLALAYWFEEPALLGYGFVGAFALLCVIFLWAVKKRNAMTSAFLRPDLKQINQLREFGKVMMPLFIYMLFMQANIVVERIVSSQQGEGVVAAVDYARILFETPAYLLGMPLGMVSLTYFSGKAWEEAKERIEQTIVYVLMLFVPMSVFFTLKSEELIVALYARGEFGADSVAMTSTALMGFSVGLWAFGTFMFLQRVYNAYFRNKELLVIGGIGVLLNVLFNLFLVPKLGIIGITLAFSASSVLQVILLVYRLKLDVKQILLVAGELLLATVAFVFISSYLHFTNVWVDLIVAGLVLVVFWGLVYLVLPTTRPFLKTASGAVLAMVRKKLKRSA